MGDRSNVFIQTRRYEAGDDLPARWAGLGLYAHWGGTMLHDAAIEAADSPAARARVGDESYFARIVVHQTLTALHADPYDDTGYGLWTHDDWFPDNEYSVLVINAQTGRHWFVNEGDHLLDEPESNIP